MAAREQDDRLPSGVYGRFDSREREYVISEPLTPLPWINYLGNKALYSILSNTGGGYSFYRDAKLRRLTRYRYDSIPADANPARSLRVSPRAWLLALPLGQERPACRSRGVCRRRRGRRIAGVAA